MAVRLIWWCCGLSSGLLLVRVGVPSQGMLVASALVSMAIYTVAKSREP